jgi:hypothetical protein
LPGGLASSNANNSPEQSIRKSRSSPTKAKTDPTEEGSRTSPFVQDFSDVVTVGSAKSDMDHHQQQDYRLSSSNAPVQYVSGSQVSAQLVSFTSKAPSQTKTQDQTQSQLPMFTVPTFTRETRSPEKPYTQSLCIQSTFTRETPRMSEATLPGATSDDGVSPTFSPHQHTFPTTIYNLPKSCKPPTSSSMTPYRPSPLEMKMSPPSFAPINMAPSPTSELTYHI